jgi:hypothetical protein
MLKSKICLICLISLIMIAWGSNNGYAQVSVTVANIQTQQDSVIKVPVIVSDLSGYGIISYQFRVVYDSMIIKAIGVSAENTLTAPWGNAVANVDSSGIMIIGAFGVKELARGDTLINLVFDVLANPGDSSYVLLEDVQFNKDYPQAIVVNGCVKIVLPTKIGHDDPQVIPRNVQLVSNYPEPFQTRTSIVIKNSGQDRVQILIFNLLGQKIKQLGMYDLKPGDLKLEWDATDNRGIRAPAGVYFCVVKSEEKILGVERMILIE